MKHITSHSELDKFTKEHDAVLIDFWAEWCKPCKALEPMLERIKKDMPGVKIAKINVGEHTALSQAVHVGSIPTIILYKKGKEVERIVGLIQEEKMKRTITSALK